MKSSSFSRHLAMPLAILSAAALSGCGVFGGKDGPKTPTVGDRVPVLSRVETSANPDPDLASVSVVVPPQKANTDWSQAGGTANKAYGHLALGASPARLWTASVAGSTNRQRLAASPVTGGGKLFVMDTKGVVTAFDANTGARVWAHPFDAPKNEHAIFGGGVSYDRDRVYVTTGVGDVAALDAATGKELWAVKPAGPLRGAPTIAFNSVYVMTQDNQIHALNAADGATR
ncbi:MAG TPA: PQQ-binding-like beta-propeller repeat protein, partial [Devosia sp.]|nr:PQQ-binding-like beta-propeller repeat protein [Devosia sp.]